MARFRNRHEIGGEWWAQDAAGQWHMWDVDAADWRLSRDGPPADEPEHSATAAGGRMFSWGIGRRPRSGRGRGFEVSFSAGRAPAAKSPPRAHSGFFHTVIDETDEFGNVTRRHRRILLRRKRPSSLREGARFFGLLTLVLADVALIEGHWVALSTCLVIAGALLAYWYITPPRARYSPDFPYDSREPPWEDRPGAEVLPDWIPRAARAGSALTLSAAVFASWMAIEASVSQGLLALVPAAAVAILAYEIPIRPVRWVVVVSLAVGSIVTFALAGFAVVFPFGSSGAESAVALGTAGFITSAAVTYTFLQLAVVLHRVEA